MQIKAPFDDIREIVPLIRAGATELYCGVYHAGWRAAGMFSNARHMDYGNLPDYKQLRKAVALASRHRVPVYLCMNEYYVAEAQALVERDIYDALGAGASGFIIADPTMVSMIRRMSKDTKIILSSLMPCFNSSALAFYHARGIDRVVLPLSQLSYAEIVELTEDSKRIGVEIEVFVNSVACKNVNGYCMYHSVGIEQYFNPREKTKVTTMLALMRAVITFFPRALKNILGKWYWSRTAAHGRACRDACTLSVFDDSGEHQATHTNLALEAAFVKGYCMLCTIPLLQECGVASGKIAGRGQFTQKKIKAVRAASAMMSAVKKGNTYTVQGRHVHEKVFGIPCSMERCVYDAWVDQLREREVSHHA